MSILQKSVPSDPSVAVAFPSPPTREVLEAMAPRAMAASDRWLRAPWARDSGPAHWSSWTLVVLASLLSGFSGFPRLLAFLAFLGFLRLASVVARVATSHSKSG